MAVVQISMSVVVEGKVHSVHVRVPLRPPSHAQGSGAL